jgi:glutathione S-transferase
MIRLHHCHQTRSMRSLWLLHELGVDFEVQIYPFDKSLRSAEYLAINPTGRVPALELDGQIICESGAIAEVLCEYAPKAGLGRPPGDPERAAWLDWIHFAETISQHTAALTQQHVALYEDHMRSPIVMSLEAKRLAKTFQTVEQGLKGRDYLLASGFSAADIGVAQAIYMGLHFATLDGCPRVAAWYDRVTNREGFRQSLPTKGAVVLYEKAFYAPWPVDR